jgi:hypothetical protein
MFALSEECCPAHSPFIIIMIPALVEHPSLIGIIFGASLGYAAFGAIAGFAFWKLVSMGGHTN